jgi:hypothetical protein
VAVVGEAVAAEARRGSGRRGGDVEQDVTVADFLQEEMACVCVPPPLSEAPLQGGVVVEGAGLVVAVV